MAAPRATGTVSVGRYLTASATRAPGTARAAIASRTSRATPVPAGRPGTGTVRAVMAGSSAAAPQAPKQSTQPSGTGIAAAGPPCNGPSAYARSDTPSPAAPAASSQAGRPPAGRAASSRAATARISTSPSGKAAAKAWFTVTAPVPRANTSQSQQAKPQPAASAAASRTLCPARPAARHRRKIASAATASGQAARPTPSASHAAGTPARGAPLVIRNPAWLAAMQAQAPASSSQGSPRAGRYMATPATMAVTALAPISAQAVARRPGNTA